MPMRSPSREGGDAAFALGRSRTLAAGDLPGEGSGTGHRCGELVPSGKYRWDEAVPPADAVVLSA